MSRQSQILIVDDDPKIRDGVARFLSQNGLRVLTANDGKAMREHLEKNRVDLIVLDLMLPGDDGLTLLRELRADSHAPVIMLTAVTGESDRVVGLELGAEDYVCKPFSLRELLARIRVVLRRQSNTRRWPNAGSVFHFAGWTLDVRARTLTSPTGGHVEVTTGEFELLQALVENPNRVLDRDQLLDLARGRSSLSVDRAIDVQIMRLRRKIEPDPKDPRLIKTVRNGGYVFTPVITRDDGNMHS
jgi:two-component system OmpR family response regulator